MARSTVRARHTLANDPSTVERSQAGTLPAAAPAIPGDAGAPAGVQCGEVHMNMHSTIVATDSDHEAKRTATGSPVSWDEAMTAYEQAHAEAEAFTPIWNELCEKEREGILAIPHATFRPDPHAGRSDPVSTADDSYVKDARRLVREVATGKCRLETETYPSLKEHFELCKEVAAAADERDAKIEALLVSLGMDEAEAKMEALGERQYETEWALLEMPAPDSAALLWKLEKLMLLEDGSCPPWGGRAIGPALNDARRLLGDRGRDDVLHAAWERRIEALSVYNALPHSEKDGEPYTPEEAAQWAIIDAAEDVIRSTVASTPEGVAIQLWTLMGHSVSQREDEEATHRRDLDYFEARGNKLDWAERLTVAALRSLQAQPADPKRAEEIAYLRVARAWVDRWRALGGSFGFICDADGQPGQLHRGMPLDLDRWEPTDKGRDDIRFRLIEEKHHAGAILALEGLMEMVPGLQDAVREIGGRDAFTLRAQGGEA